MNDVQELFAENLKRIRARLGLSQIELANMSGISNSYLGDIETARKFPSGRTIQILVDTLGVTPDELFKDTSLVAAESAQINTVSKAELLQLKKRIAGVIDEAIGRLSDG